MAGNQFPSQLLTYNQKIKKDNEKMRETMDAICRMSNLVSFRNNWRITRLYDVVNGKIDDNDYDEILKPYGKKRDSLPNELRNYPLLNTDLGVLLGEKNEMGTNFQVITSNPDVNTEQEEAIMKALRQEDDQEFVNELNRMNEPTGEPSERTRNPREVANEKKDTFKSTRAVQGQEALNYLHQNLEYHDVSMDNWYDYLVGGYTFTFKNVMFDDVYYESLNPPDCDYDKDSDIEFVEDGDWALVRKLQLPSSIIDMHHDELTDDQIKDIENSATSWDGGIFPGQGGKIPFFTAYTQEDIREEQNDRGMHGTIHQSYGDRLVEKVYVCWKSRRKIGFLTFTDILGEAQEMMVDEDYKPRKELGEEIEWKWINEVWEGYIINGKHYVGIRPVPQQRNNLNNASECKLPINGRAHSNMNTRNISFVELGLPFQTTYNIYKWKLNNAISKAKDVMALLDINIIPKNWDMDKWMFMVEKTGIGWVDYHKESMQDLPPNHQTVLDLSLKTIDQYVTLLNNVVAEWERVSGITAQRRASIGQYQGKATTEQAIIQSSYMTDDFYRKFQRFEQRELQGLLDLSKIAWRGGKKGSYINTANREQMMDIDGATFSESNFSVFVTSSRQEKMKKEKAEQLIQPYMQNAGKLSTSLDIIQSNSFEKIKSQVKEAERIDEQMQQQIQEAQQEGYKKGKQEADKQKDRELAIKERDSRRKYDLGVEKNEIDEKGTEYDYDIDQQEVDVKEEEADIKRQQANDSDNNEGS